MRSINSKDIHSNLSDTIGFSFDLLFRQDTWVGSSIVRFTSSNSSSIDRRWNLQQWNGIRWRIHLLLQADWFLLHWFGPSIRRSFTTFTSPFLFSFGPRYCKKGLSFGICFRMPWKNRNGGNLFLLLFHMLSAWNCWYVINRSASLRHFFRCTATFNAKSYLCCCLLLVGFGQGGCQRNFEQNIGKFYSVGLHRHRRLPYLWLFPSN